MWQWFVDSLTAGQEMKFDVLAARLTLAFLLGSAVAAIYWFTLQAPSAGNGRTERPITSFVSTLVLLSILIAMVTQVVGSELARAFALVGALSVVRFRTVVEDTRDTAFVIFAVVVGMAVGAGQPEVALIGLVVGGAAAALTRPRRLAAEGLSPSWSLTVRIGVGQNPEDLLEATLRECLEDWHLLASVTGRQGAALDLTYRVRLRPTCTPTNLVGALNRLEGVQSVELRRL